ncbi:GNAT family N-acetyltransferase [Paenibacillaceae bacterium]|nr:GNAT family N-acetyltransferase [Paenibacillaceae bacterium]
MNKKFDEVFRIMEASFPRCERRSYEGQQELLDNPHYRLLTEKDAEGKVIAFLAGWEFANFRFIEHIAVDRAIRGGGLGSKLMNKYCRESDKPVLLEVELPDDEMAQRRIGFYERLGFHLNDFDYIQPPLQAGEPEIPLLIMTSPERITAEQFRTYREVLYREVYHWRGPLVH